MFKKVTAVVGAVALFGAVATTAYAQASKDEIAMCIETVEQMTGGKASGEAKKLCEQGKMEEAIATAMGG